MIDWKTLFTSPAGRLGRADFGLAVVIIVSAALLFGPLPRLGVLINLALLWAGWCVCAKRLRDAGLPTWVAAVPLAAFTLALTLAIIEGTTGASATDIPRSVKLAGGGPYAVAVFATLLAGLAFLVWLGVRPQHRDDPRLG